MRLLADEFGADDFDEAQMADQRLALIFACAHPAIDAVLDAIYAAFAEGWSDPAGTDVARRDLPDEAMFLCRVVDDLLPDEPEVLRLLALMLHAEARRKARRGTDGEYIPLAEQDPARWDAKLIEEAEALLLRASTRGSIGRFQLAQLAQLGVA